MSALLTFVTTAPLRAERQIVPAGSLIQCTTGEKISSMTEAVGDPVACQITQSPKVNQDGLVKSGLPYGAVLTGEFTDYKDPGHLVGKGWMQLTFDRVVVNGNTPIGVTGKVVNVKGYKIDKDGKILGKGHPVRDIVEWSIPLLWPIDLINLPRRGPKPVLKPETRLTVKLMDDLVMNTPGEGLPAQAPTRDAYGFTTRPMSYNAPPAASAIPESTHYIDVYNPPAQGPASYAYQGWTRVGAGGSAAGAVVYVPYRAQARGYGYPPPPPARAQMSGAPRMAVVAGRR